MDIDQLLEMFSMDMEIPDYPDDEPIPDDHLRHVFKEKEV